MAIGRRNTVEARRRLLDLENEIINLTVEKDRGAGRIGRDAVDDAFEVGKGIV